MYIHLFVFLKQRQNRLTTQERFMFQVISLFFYSILNPITPFVIPENFPILPLIPKYLRIFPFR